MGGTVTRFDAIAEHEKTRTALRAAIPRVVRLLRDVRDLDAASGVPVWSVGDVGAHLAAAFLAYRSAVSADGAMDWDSLLPPGDVSFAERIKAVNDQSIDLFPAEERAHLGDFVAEQGEAFLRVTEGVDPDTPVTTPWLGPESALTVAAFTGLLLNECLLHGLDIARGAGLPWPIGPDEARSVIGQALPATMPLALDTAGSRGTHIAFDLAVRGGPRLAVVVDDGTLTVTRDAPPRAYDCRITAAPTAFLLVSFGRMPLWKAIARGQLRAGGRRPWLAMRFGKLIASP